MPIAQRCRIARRASPVSPTPTTRDYHQAKPEMAHTLFVFEPRPSPEPRSFLDRYADEVLRSYNFKVACTVAFQAANRIPRTYPPKSLADASGMPIEPFYQAVLVEFERCFKRILRAKNVFPLKNSFQIRPEGNELIAVEDITEFNRETYHHIDAILKSFHEHMRPFGSLDNLFIDDSMPHAFDAQMALEEATATAFAPPKHIWKAGEYLHSEYRRKLWMFRARVTRQLEKWGQNGWILNARVQLDRGLTQYEEYYIAQLRACYPVIVGALNGKRWLIKTFAPVYEPLYTTARRQFVI